MSVIRVSIANLAWFASFSGGDRVAFAIRNPNKEDPHFMALGGGAMLNEEGKKMLESSFGAFDFEKDEKTGFFDARFKLPEEHVEAVFTLFAQSDAEEFEKDRTLDIRAELLDFLSEEDLLQVKVLPIQVVSQAPAKKGTDTSHRASSIETRRLFRIFNLKMPEGVLAWFFACQRVRKLTDAERATTSGGSTAGVTNDGAVLQNNLFII